VEIAVHEQIATILQVSWSQDRGVDAAWVEYSFEDDTWVSTPRRAGTAGPHNQSVLGLPTDTSVSLRIVNELDGERLESDTSWSASTGALPLAGLAPAMVDWDPELASEAPWLLLSIEVHDGQYYDGPYWVLILDRQGRVVWYRQLPDGLSCTFPKPSRSGDHLVMEQVDRFGLGAQVEPSLQRLTLDLSELQEFTLPGFGFSWDEAEDGSIYYDEHDESGQGWLSRLLPDGSTERLFDCTTWMDKACVHSWCCQVNAVVSAPTRGSLLWSMWADHTVLEVDASTGGVLNQWGQLEGSWAFDPPEAAFELQHWPNFTADGTLLVSTHVPGQPGQQRAREFRLDEHSDTLTQIWSYGEGLDLYATYQGEARRLENGNTLVNFGTEGVLHEITASGQLAWRLQWSQPWMLGHSTPLEDLYALNGGG